MADFCEAAYTGLSRRIGLGKRDGAAVRLLRADYLVTLWRQGKQLQRRQDIAEEDFFDDRLDQAGTRIVVVSYRWHTKTHPDPEGYSLAILAPMLHTYMSGCLNLAVFIDFCSLYQSPRSDAQSTLFKEGLKSINVLYAHQFTHVWCFTRVPESVASYENSGWCTFERTIASVLTESGKLWDVGRFPPEHMPLLNQPGHLHTIQALAAWCTTSVDGSPFRRPPPSAARFRALLARKTFTNGKEDHELVASLYESFLSEGLGAAETLTFQQCEWGNDEVATLAGEVLPLCPRLTQLNLSNNHFGDEGLVLLAAALPLALEALHLHDVVFSEVGACALATRLPPNVWLLSLSVLATPADGQPAIGVHVISARGCVEIDRFRRYYMGGAAERAAVLLEASAARAAKSAQKGARGPIEVTVDGMRLWRRLQCHPGRVCAKHFGAQPWILSPDEPVVDGAPHYELDNGAEGPVLHLYRYDPGSSFEKRWQVGPVLGAMECLVGIPSDALYPWEATRSGNFWLVLEEFEHGKRWTGQNTGFGFTPLLSRRWYGLHCLRLCGWPRTAARGIMLTD